MKNTYDVVIIGSGPGGLAAAISAKENGAEDVLIIERDVELGGILLQCIHNGFGLELFNEDMPGPAYAQHFIQEVRGHGVDTLMDTMVLDITPDRTIYAINKSLGYIELRRGQLSWRWAAVSARVPKSCCPGHGRPAFIRLARPSALSMLKATCPVKSLSSWARVISA
jgi:hypothetical protein